MRKILSYIIGFLSIPYVFWCWKIFNIETDIEKYVFIGSMALLIPLWIFVIKQYKKISTSRQLRRLSFLVISPFLLVLTINGLSVSWLPKIVYAVVISGYYGMFWIAGSRINNSEDYIKIWD